MPDLLDDHSRGPVIANFIGLNRFMPTATTKRKLGPLTVGTVLGAGIGMLDTVPVLDSIRQGTQFPDTGSVLLVPFGVAFLGGMLGIAAEFVNQRLSCTNHIWFRHFLRPLLFCTVPYLLFAFSFACFGDIRFLGGFGFWICVIFIPVLGLSVAWRRSTETKLDVKCSAAHKCPITYEGLDRAAAEE